MFHLPTGGKVGKTWIHEYCLLALSLVSACLPVFRVFFYLPSVGKLPRIGFFFFLTTLMFVIE